MIAFSPTETNSSSGSRRIAPAAHKAQAINVEIIKKMRERREREALFSLYLMSTQATFYLCHAKQRDKRIFWFHFRATIHPLFLNYLYIVLMKINLRLWQWKLFLLSFDFVPSSLDLYVFFYYMLSFELKYCKNSLEQRAQRVVCLTGQNRFVFYNSAKCVFSTFSKRRTHFWLHFYFSLGTAGSEVFFALASNENVGTVFDKARIQSSEKAAFNYGADWFWYKSTRSLVVKQIAESFLPRENASNKSHCFRLAARGDLLPLS